MKAGARKLRPDAWWSRLHDQQVQEAFALVCNMGIALAAKAIAEQFKIPAPSVSAVSRFYRWARTMETQWRIEKAVADKDQISATHSKIGDLDPTVKIGLDALALDAIASRDPKMVTQYLSALTSYLAVKDGERKTSLMERRVQLLEKKAAQADAAEGVAKDSNLTPEERDRKFREIFGVK